MCEQSGYEVTVEYSVDYLREKSSEWDGLLASSAFKTVFLTAGWLHAWIETFGGELGCLFPQVRKNGKLVGAAAFSERDGVVRFIGRGRSDYLGFLLANELDQVSAARVVEMLLVAAKEAATNFRYFLLGCIPLDDKVSSYLQGGGSRFSSTVTRIVVAPRMDMTVAGEKLRKKSLRRHECGLQRMGDLHSSTFTHVDEISPWLSKFFEQHIRRWQATQYPSLFLDDKNREFYRKVTQNLDLDGWLRFTLLQLDGRLIAAHYGFLYSGSFLWYKPTFDSRLAKHSPGEVLLKRVIEQAEAEKAREFDFGLGDEVYKDRFATDVRKVAYFHVRDSWFPTLIERLRSIMRNKG